MELDREKNCSLMHQSLWIMMCCVFQKDRLEELMIRAGFGCPQCNFLFETEHPEF